MSHLLLLLYCLESLFSCFLRSKEGSIQTSAPRSGATEMASAVAGSPNTQHIQQTPSTFSKHPAHSANTQHIQQTPSTFSKHPAHSATLWRLHQLSLFPFLLFLPAHPPPPFFLKNNFKLLQALTEVAPSHSLPPRFSKSNRIIMQVEQHLRSA